MKLVIREFENGIEITVWDGGVELHVVHAETNPAGFIGMLGVLHFVLGKKYRVHWTRIWLMHASSLIRFAGRKTAMRVALKLLRRLGYDAIAADTPFHAPGTVDHDDLERRGRPTVH